MSDPEQNSKDPLADKLDELEGLLEQKTQASHAKPQASIPVLDEIVTTADYPADETTPAAAGETENAADKAGKTHDKSP